MLIPESYPRTMSPLRVKVPSLSAYMVLVRPTVIVSGTVSDPTAVAANAAFVLNLNRANVAFSRVQDRLVVVCSRALLDHIPAEIEHYESAALWKALRDLCTEFVSEAEVGGHRVKLYRPPPGCGARVG